MAKKMVKVTMSLKDWEIMKQAMAQEMESCSYVYEVLARDMESGDRENRKFLKKCEEVTYEVEVYNLRKKPVSLNPKQTNNEDNNQ